MVGSSGHPKLSGCPTERATICYCRSDGGLWVGTGCWEKKQLTESQGFTSINPALVSVEPLQTKVKS